MEITWYKDSCFKISGKKANVVVGNAAEHGVDGDIILTSLLEDGAYSGDGKVFNWPGEYEMKDVLINAFLAWTKPRNKEEDIAIDSDSTLVFRFDVDGIKICHLGALGHSLTSELVDKIGDVDVLMINIGEGSNLDKNKALEIIEAIEPRITIPMGGNGLVSSLTEMGVQEPEQEEKLLIKSASSLPNEQMRYLVLNTSA